MTRAATNPDPFYEEDLAGDLNTFVVGVVTFLHIMFLERKYLSMLCFSVQIVINITKPDVTQDEEYMTALTPLGCKYYTHTTVYALYSNALQILVYFCPPI